MRIIAIIGLISLLLIGTGCSTMRSKKVVYDCVNTDEGSMFVCDVPWLR